MIETLIAFDPSTITVTRHTAVLADGNTTCTEEVLSPVVVRFYRKTAWQERTESASVKGETASLVAPSDADFKCGHDCYDTFSHEDRTWRVAGVRRYMDANIPEHLQINCEAV